MTNYFKGKAKSYEDMKLRAILAVLNTTHGLVVEDDMGKVTIADKNGVFATIEISVANEHEAEGTA